MRWLFLALLGPALDTVVNFLDKYVIEHKLKDSHSLPVYAGIVSLVLGTTVWLVCGMPTLSGHNACILLLSGTIYMGANALYFHALAKSHTSYIVALLQVIPIFVLVMSFLLLDEPLSLQQLIGFALVFTAVLGMSIDKTERKIKLTTAFYQIIAADVLFAVSAVLIKYAVDLEGFVPILAYESWGFAIGSLILFLGFKRIRRAFLGSLRSVGTSTVGVVALNESIATLSQTVTFLAITLGPVALVSVLMGTQIFYALLFGVALTLLFPRFFHEDIAKRDIARKVAMSIVLFIGVVCIGASA